MIHNDFGRGVVNIIKIRHFKINESAHFYKSFWHACRIHFNVTLFCDDLLFAIKFKLKAYLFRRYYQMTAHSQLDSCYCIQRMELLFIDDDGRDIFHTDNGRRHLCKWRRCISYKWEKVHG